MTGWVFVLVGLAGGVGAGLRFIVDGALNARRSTGFPIGSMTVNLIGSGGLGLITGLAHAYAWGDGLVAILGAGLMGGFTTFSSAMVEAARLIMEQRDPRGLAFPVLMLGGALAAALAGLLLGAVIG